MKWWLDFYRIYSNCVVLVWDVWNFIQEGENERMLLSLYKTFCMKCGFCVQFLFKIKIIVVCCTNNDLRIYRVVCLTRAHFYV